MARKYSEPSNDHLRVKSDGNRSRRKRHSRNRKRPGERIRDDDNDKSRRRATVDENSEPDRRNDRRLESENDRHRNRDRRCRSRHDSDDDQEEDHIRRDDRRPESRNDRSNRNTEGENRSDYRRPESENDRYGYSDQRRHSRHVSDDGDEDHGRRRDNNNQPSSRNRDDNSFKEKVKGEIKQKQSAPQETNLNGDTANLGRSGGIYIPPFKLVRMMKETQDKSSDEYQRLTWDALRKSIKGLVNKNLIRGRGLFCRSCMKSQMASPSFTDVFAALVTVVNTKFPEVGDLLLRKIVLQLKRAYKRNDKHQLLAAVKFIAHLVNQQVAHEIIALELLTVLLEYPTDDSVEVAVGFVTECGSLLQDLSPKCLHGIFERFRFFRLKIRKKHWKEKFTKSEDQLERVEYLKLIEELYEKHKDLFSMFNYHYMLKYDDNSHSSNSEKTELFKKQSDEEKTSTDNIHYLELTTKTFIRFFTFG
ncbi:hypothetical protein ERO13_D10G107150v2 [Gossypium hirsutum]|nr:hypothetical protein ERO13_D10G107150v2 [Gossypium hirsutum]